MTEASEGSSGGSVDRGNDEVLDNGLHNPI